MKRMKVVAETNTKTNKRTNKLGVNKLGVNKLGVNKLGVNKLGQRLPEHPLTRKQKAFADKIINNPKMSGTRAALETYDTKDPRTASIIATDNMHNPKVISYLAAHSRDIEGGLVKTFNDFKDSKKINERRLSTDVGMWIHDKIHGKAVQRNEVQQTTVNLNLDINSISE